MISKFFRRGRRGAGADLGFYAPLVLLPFVLFVTGACIDVPKEFQGIGGPPQPDGQYGNTPYYNYPDHTRYGQNTVCTQTGGYGGGSDAELASTRASIASAVEGHKQAIAEEDNKIKQCLGREITDAQLDAKFGCNRAMRNTYGLDVLDGRATPEQVANHQRCERATQEPTGPPSCRSGSVEGRRARQAYLREQLAADQARLNNVDACIADKRRREQAEQQQNRPRIDPSVLIFSNPGLFGGGGRPSRPSSGHGTGTHKE